MSRDDRERLSWSEVDKLRSQPRPRPGDRRGPPPKEQERLKEQALKHADSLFFVNQGGAAGARLATAMRDAHGTPELADACRAFLSDVGLPKDPSLLSLFLDTGDTELVVMALEALLETKNAGGLEVSSGLRVQLRVLGQDSDDTIAGISEELLEA